jgi:hypothetical protein
MKRKLRSFALKEGALVGLAIAALFAVAMAACVGFLWLGKVAR